MRYILFELSMPQIGSWNGQWTGSNNFYGIIKKFSKSKKQNEQVESLLKAKSFSYAFGDGWTASISVKELDRKQTTKIKSHLKGFCNYDWMVDSIIDYGEILTAEREKEIKKISEGILATYKPDISKLL